MKSLARRITGGCLLGAMMMSGPGAADGPGKVDPALQPYETVPGVSGQLNGRGSETLGNLMDLWMAAFTERYASVQATYVGEGSSTAPTALIEGTAQLGPMSRAMRPEEEGAIKKKYGARPTGVTVAFDCLAVFVHRDNPVRGLTVPQLDCIFSQTRKSGFAEVTRWGQVGPADEKSWANLPIRLYGRNSASGTYAHFKRVALLGGEFKESVREQAGSAMVVDGVASDRAGIGYSGISYQTPDVRALPLSRDHTAPLAEPTFENALAGKYPLGRALYVYVVKKPDEPLPLVVKEFVKFVLSRQGQEIVVQGGFGPLPAEAVAAELRKIE